MLPGVKKQQQRRQRRLKEVVGWVRSSGFPGVTLHFTQENSKVKQQQQQQRQKTTKE